MNKNTVWAVLLIGAILVGFSMYNSKVAKEQQRVQFVQDSIARAQAIELMLSADPEGVLQDGGKTVQEEQVTAETKGTTAGTTGQRYTNTWLNRHHEGEAFHVLENEKLRIVFQPGRQAL